MKVEGECHINQDCYMTHNAEEPKIFTYLIVKNKKIE